MERRKLLLLCTDFPPGFHQVRSFPSSPPHPSPIAEAYAWCLKEQCKSLTTGKPELLLQPLFNSVFDVRALACPLPSVPSLGAAKLCWALILNIPSSCQAVEPVVWKQPFTPVHGKWERKGLILPRSSSSQRKHHRLSEMRSYKNSLTLQAECSGRTENPSSVLADAQCLMGAEATTTSPVHCSSNAQTLLISLWCAFFSWCRDKTSASNGPMCTYLFKSIYVWLSPQEQYLSLPSSYFPILLFGKIFMASSGKEQSDKCKNVQEPIYSCHV